MSKKKEKTQAVTVQEHKELVEKLDKKLKTVGIREVPQAVEKKSLRGTYEIGFSYNIGGVSVHVKARHHTLNAKEVEDKIKSLVVWRDSEGKRVVYRQTPFRFGHFRADEETGELALKKTTIAEVEKMVKATAQALAPENAEEEPDSEVAEPSKDETFVLPFVARNGELYTVSEVDRNTCKPYAIEDGKEHLIDQFEKTKEINITEDDLRPSGVYEDWLVERSKEIFAVEPEDQQGLWVACQDMIKRDAVAVIKVFVEKKGLTTYHLIVKPVYYVEKGQFILMGAEVRKPFILEWLMNVPMETIKQTAKRTVDLLAKVTGTDI